MPGKADVRSIQDFLFLDSSVVSAFTCSRLAEPCFQSLMDRNKIPLVCAKPTKGPPPTCDGGAWEF
eukprot:5257365-Amphidinium_carterae.1